MTDQLRLGKTVLQLLDGQPFPYTPGRFGFGFTILRPEPALRWIIVRPSRACDGTGSVLASMRAQVLDEIEQRLAAAGYACAPWPPRAPILLAVAEDSDDAADALTYLNERNRTHG
ncbi:hypothetical protein EDD29_0117 [Actinocorallia herbida]|uniref:Uncharacterized protein n=1 Tax=Actinocorallia herbida TaxID=58109 RepID=A0A3N1CMT3_9ACTN|nr:hypothetical protein [Actinocorallia herbida]ROO82636.1 hypothetical protein EDD29_0117 [Actinocorallia herbida]